LNFAEAKYYQELTKVLDRIEDRIVSLAGTDLPTQDGKLIELQSAVAYQTHK
jgi:hypothetical protein